MLKSLYPEMQTGPLISCPVTVFPHGVTDLIAACCEYLQQVLDMMSLECTDTFSILTTLFQLELIAVIMSQP